jgi:osmotically-inducible protein OsmY
MEHTSQTLSKLVAAAALAAILGGALSGAACSPVGLAAGAGAGVGVAAAQERGVSGAFNDTDIRLQINHLWFQHDLKLYREINLQVQEGRVLLTGTVEQPETRVDAVRLAWQADGVREVINEIEVTDETTLTDAARDVRISTEIKSKLLLDAEIYSINYSIEVVNQVLYLMGVAQDQAELDRVKAHARNIPYLRRIVDYVRLKGEPLLPIPES